MADYYLVVAESTGLARQLLMNAYGAADLDKWALARLGQALRQARESAAQRPIGFAAIANMRKEIAHLTGRGFLVPYT
jgi:hypothetical protein